MSGNCCEEKEVGLGWAKLVKKMMDSRSEACHCGEPDEACDSCSCKELHVIR